MRAAGLCARPRSRFVPKTTRSRHDGSIASNLLAQRAAPPTRPDEVWAVDMAHIETAAGWLFLAVVLDLHRRKIVGWAFAESLHPALPLAALRMALRAGGVRPGDFSTTATGACQYARAACRHPLAAHGLEASMSRTGNPYDNARVESFCSTLKTECLHRHAPATRVETKAVALDYIETFHNPARLHSALGYPSPVDFENSHH